MHRNPVWGERKAARARRHGPALGAAYDDWLQDGPVVECDDCERTEREHHDTFRSIEGRMMCPLCAVKAGVDE